MPDRILHVIGIHGSVRLKLRTAILVTPGVIESNAALPEFWSDVGNELHQVVETGGRLHDSALLEIRNSAVADIQRILSTRLRREGDHGNKEGNKKKSHGITS
jgi:hypothetical protein